MKIRKKRPRRGNAFLKVLLVLLLTAGISFGGASIWQHLQESKQVQSSSPQISAGDSLSQEHDDDSEEKDADLDVSVSPIDEPSDESSISFEAEATGTKGDANFSAPDSEEETSNDIEAEYSVQGQVAVSDKVDNDYFDDAIFFGDSISTGITIYNVANNTACVAAIGVSPSSILSTPYIPTKEGGKITVLEAAKAYDERKKVYIMLGGNGLWQDKESFISDYQKFIDAVKVQYPGAIIYIQSMTPVARGVEIKYPSISHQKVLEYNVAIAQLAKDNKLPFVNVFEALCDSQGYLPEGISADGLHLSAEYYFKWFDYLKSHTV